MEPWDDEAGLRRTLARLHEPPDRVWVVAHHQIPRSADFAGVSVIPHDAEAFARALYAELHRCDEAGAPVILVEAPPDEPAWRGIADRLRRAASRA